jgi:hypothetical protein
MDNQRPTRLGRDEDFSSDESPDWGDDSHDRLRLRDRVVQIINSAILE